MATIAIDGLLAPVGADEPCGPDLDGSQEYLAVFKAAEGTPERGIGDTVVPGEEPDWRQVHKLAGELLHRSKDLRVAVLLARAALRTDGLAGLGQGLALLKALIDRYWDGLHPKLDPTDDNDPIARVNILLDLCARETLLDPLRTTPLIRSRVFGAIALRDIEVAEGKARAPADSKPLDLASVEGAFRDCDLDELAQSAAAASQALAEARALGAGLATWISPAQLPDLEPLIKPLATVSALLAGHLAERAPAGSPGSPGSALAADASDGGAPPVRPSSGAGGEIANRDDVLRALDRICDYYSRNEPSSPVPLLLRRAGRLVNGGFVDIVRDLAPDALAQIEKLCGLEQQS